VEICGKSIAFAAYPGKEEIYMRWFVKTIIPMAVTAAVTHVLMFMVLGDILLTVSFAMVGEKWAALPYMFFLFAVQVGAILLVWRVRKPRDSEARREYLKALGGEVYSRKADRKVVSRDKTFRAELVAYAVTVFVQMAVEFSVAVIVFAPIAYLIFHIYNRRLWLALHETWADERIRLNPEA
jgi:hypothetical protein